MTRKDYNAVAAAVRNTMHDATRRVKCDDELGAVETALEDLVGRLVLIFKDDNPHFDSDRFWKACDPSTMTSRGVAS